MKLKQILSSTPDSLRERDHFKDNGSTDQVALNFELVVFYFLSSQEVVVLLFSKYRTLSSFSHLHVVSSNTDSLALQGILAVVEPLILLNLML